MNGEAKHGEKLTAGRTDAAVRPGLSLWQDTVSFTEAPALRGTEKTDVLIVGGGLAGVLCAHALAQWGVDCIIAEQNRVGQGITAKTTGKITSQHGLIYDKLLRAIGKEGAARYLEVSQRTITHYEEMAAQIDCGFQRRSNLVYSLRGRARLEREMDALGALGFEARFREGGETALPFLVDGAVEFPMQAQFHPLKLMAGLLRADLGRVKVLEHTQALDLEVKAPGAHGTSGTGAVIAKCRTGEIHARAVIVATHFPFWGRHGAYFLKLYQSRASVIAGSGGPQLDGMYVDESGEGLSFRNCGKLLLVGGGGSRTGKGREDWRSLEWFCQSHYPQWETRYQWANQDCISLDGLPYIGPYGGTGPVYVATGFHKWGMTGAMVSAMVLSDLVLGRQNEYAALFNPSRSMLKPQLFVNGMASAAHLLTPTVPRCRHLGCALKWNAQEKTWDCPCHGSRYDGDGRCIENPSKHGFCSEEDPLS